MQRTLHSYLPDAVGSLDLIKYGAERCGLMVDITFGDNARLPLWF